MADEFKLMTMYIVLKQNFFSHRFMRTLTFTFKRDIGKQRMTYIESLSKWMAEEGWGKIKKIIKSSKRQKIVKSYDRKRPEITRHMEDYK